MRLCLCPSYLLSTLEPTPPCSRLPGLHTSSVPCILSFPNGVAMYHRPLAGLQDKERWLPTLSDWLSSGVGFTPCFVDVATQVDLTRANTPCFGVCPTLVRRMLAWHGFPVNRFLPCAALAFRAGYHFIALLHYSDDAKPAGWFYQEEANKGFA